MNLLVRIAPAALLAVLLWGGGAEAAGVRLGLGADYWTNNRGLMHLSLTVDAPLARNIYVGGRFGALATTSPTTFGVPLDLSVRALLARRRVYVEGLVGPWLLFDRGDGPLHLHGAFGFGMQSSSLSFGIEVGWLDPRPHVGLRLGFQI